MTTVTFYQKKIIHTLNENIEIILPKNIFKIFKLWTKYVLNTKILLKYFTITIVYIYLQHILAL